MVILGIPWLVVVISFAINVAIWALADPAGEQDGGFTGGILALYITVLVVYVQAVTQLLPFAMGVSLSRRTFFLGDALVAVVQSPVLRDRARGPRRHRETPPTAGGAA